MSAMEAVTTYVGIDVAAETLAVAVLAATASYWIGVATAEDWGRRRAPSADGQVVGAEPGPF